MGWTGIATRWTRWGAEEVFAERGERGGVFGRKWWRVWPLQVSLAAIVCCGSLSGGNWPLQVFLAAIVCCRSLWWPVLAAAGLSGCNWPLQVSLAAIVCCGAVVRLLYSPLF